MLSDHVFLSALGAAGFWSLVSPSATASYAVGALLGGFYLFLLQRQTDSVGASSLEDVRSLTARQPLWSPLGTCPSSTRRSHATPTPSIGCRLALARRRSWSRC